MFIAIGEIINDCMLVQVESGKGKMIELYSGNRVTDTLIPLVKEVEGDVTSEYGTWIANIPKSVTGSVIRRQHMNLEFVELPKPAKPTKPDTISFIRYVRPVADRFSRLGYQLDAKKGLTFLIQLDYIQRTVKFQYSICNGDNFSKKVGVEKAFERTEKMKGYYQLKLPEYGIPDDGTVEFIIGAIASDYLGKTNFLGLPNKDAELILTFKGEAA